MQNEQSAVECIKENVKRHLSENIGIQTLLENVYFSANYAIRCLRKPRG